MGVEMQIIIDGDAEIRRNKKRKEAFLLWCVWLPICCVLSLCIVLALKYYRVNAHYSVAADSASGLLDANSGLTFNLTLGVASRSQGADACINPGVYVEVFYRGIRVAASDGAAQVEQRCARPMNVSELPVVARATALPVGQGLESLAAEMRDGAAVFDFVLHVPARSYGGYSWRRSWVTLCKGGRVGGAAVLCDSPNQND